MDKREWKQKIFTWLYVILIVAVLIFMVWVVSYMRSNATQCLQDPIKYFQEKNPEAICTCIKDGVTWPDTTSSKPNPNYEPLIINTSFFDEIK